jgi:uncharacterized protein (DUF58 family)
VTAATLIQPSELAKVHRLEVVARLVVEGLMAGGHRSPHRGQSVDFADHRAYAPGDDLRHLDWKVLGRSDRLVLKRYEAETDLACLLVVDGSGSMAYAGKRSGVSKYRYAAVLAAALAWLVVRQQDRPGLTIANGGPVAEVAPRFQGAVARICHALENHVPDGAFDPPAALAQLSAPSCGRGMVLILSDLLDDPDHLAAALDRLGHRGHDLVVGWLLDPDEIDLALPFGRFEGLEGDGQLVAEPRALRHAYQQQVEAHRAAITQICRARRAALVECRTDEPPHLPLNRLLVTLHERSK